MVACRGRRHADTNKLCPRVSPKNSQGAFHLVLNLFPDLKYLIRHEYADDLDLTTQRGFTNPSTLHQSRAVLSAKS